jgi:hypothetical protein
VITACCLYGEALCDRCEAKRLAWQTRTDNFWADIADLVALPFRKLAGVIVADQSASRPLLTPYKLQNSLDKETSRCTLLSFGQIPLEQCGR